MILLLDYLSKIAGWVVSSVDSDQTPRSVVSDLGLLYSLSPVCPKKKNIIEDTYWQEMPQSPAQPSRGTKIGRDVEKITKNTKYETMDSQTGKNCHKGTALERILRINKVT